MSTTNKQNLGVSVAKRILPPSLIKYNKLKQIYQNNEQSNRNSP